MPAIKTIDLIAPIPFGGQMVTSLTLKEPGLREYATFGDPVVQTRSAGGAWVVVENSDSIIGYMRACVSENQRGVLDHVGLADLLKLKDEILGFFGDARAAGANDAPNSSSATSDGSAQATTDD